MASDRVVINLDQRARKGGDGLRAVMDRALRGRHGVSLCARFGNEYRYVAPWHRWIMWDGKRWVQDSTGSVFALIRKIVHEAVGGTRNERKIATAGYIAGVERLARYDQSIVVLPCDLDADPWLLNTQAGIVDLRTGMLRDHDPAALMTRLTGASPAAVQGNELWELFLKGITQGDAELASYLQRLGGYCMTGGTSEDVLPYFFGVGSNGKSSFAEALAAALGDYAIVFRARGAHGSQGRAPPDGAGPVHGCAPGPVQRAQLLGHLERQPGQVADRGRDDLCPVHARGQLHLPTHPQDHRRRQPHAEAQFRHPGHPPADPDGSVSSRLPGCAGAGMRERLKQEALGAVLAWAIAGTVQWRQVRYRPAGDACALLTEDYLADEDGFGQWLAECCVAMRQRFRAIQRAPS